MDSSGDNADAVTAHYGSDDLAGRILRALADAGHDVDRLDPDALSGVDEFHLGGRRATLEVAGSLGVAPGGRVLDVGCGIGGAARALARRFDALVTGIDLTPEFVATARVLTERCGLSDRCEFEVGSALELPFADGRHDAVTMLHVGMNIADKAALMGELVRVTNGGGTVVVYDLMRIGAGDIPYPVPWAADSSTSYVAPPDDYVAGFRAAGVSEIEVADHTELVVEVMEAATSGPPPPASLVHLMGPDFPAMVSAVMAAIRAGTLAPTAITAHLPVST